MAVLRLYPYAIDPGSGSTHWTDAQLTQILGNSTNTISKSAYLNVNNGVYGGFYFDTTQVPVGAIVNSITAGVRAYCNLANYRQFYSFEVFRPSPTSSIYTTGGPNLTNAMSDLTLARNNYPWPVDSIRDTTLIWNFCFMSLVTSTATIYWQKAWVDIDYTPGASPGVKNVLYLGENF